MKTYTFGLNNETEVERKCTRRGEKGDYGPKVYNRDYKDISRALPKDNVFEWLPLLDSIGSGANSLNINGRGMPSIYYK